MRKEKIENLKIAVNIWSMIAAASFASAFFEGHFILGSVLGVYAVYMARKLTSAWVCGEEGVQ